MSGNMVSVGPLTRPTGASLPELNGIQQLNLSGRSPNLQNESTNVTYGANLWIVVDRTASYLSIYLAICI